MAFSLSSWFKGKPGTDTDEASSGSTAKQTPKMPPPAPAAPPPAVRTVLPTGAPSQNPVSLRPPGAPPLPKPPAPTQTRNLPVRPPARKVSFPIPAAAAAPVRAPIPAPAVPASAPVPAPVQMEAPEVAVHLTIGDFIDRIPPGYLQSGDFDRDQTVEFRASELYSDLSKGRASVPASTIYARCPQIFARPVTDTEDFEVQLPLQKLVEQLSAAFTTRADQVAEENVGEIETPFLKVAMEDNARLPTASGTAAGALRPAIAPPTEATASSGIPQRPAHRTGQISTISAKPAIEPTAAPTFTPPTAPINPGKRPPSTVRASVAGGKIRLSGPAAPVRMASVPGPVVPPPVEAKPPGATQRVQVPSIQPVNLSAASSPSHQVTKKTARIQIPPISLKGAGTGSNTPRPPGAIPPPPSMPVQASPVTIRPGAADAPVSFRSSPPPPPSVKVPPPSFAPSRPSFPPPSFPAMPPAGGSTPPPAVPTAVPSPFASTDSRQISLGLAAVLRGQPSSALAVEPSDVPDDVRISLPFGLIERQLSTGRVVVPRAAFVNALPEAHKGVLASDGEVSEVQIPLQEVFQNLPGNALAMRQDQVVEEVGEAYPTPFSQKAEEDAQRLGMVAPVAPPVPETAPVEEASPFAAEQEAPDQFAYTAGTAPAAEPFGAVFEEQPAAIVEEPTTPADEPVAIDEAPALQTPVEEEAPSRDLPLPPEEPADEEAAADAATPVEEASPVSATVTDIHPAEPAVEPPVAIEPPPVAEALAVLESSAPGQDQPAKPAPSFQESARETTPAPAAPRTAGRPALAQQDTVLQTLLMTEDELDAKSVVRHVCLLPGVTGCAVMFADGLRLAGNFPEGDAEGFSAMAPPFFKRTVNFAHETDLGSLGAITLYTDRGLLSFFMHEDICLSVRHTGRGFLPGVREKLEAVTRELASMYSTEKSDDSTAA